MDSRSQRLQTSEFRDCPFSCTCPLQLLLPLQLHSHPSVALAPFSCTPPLQWHLSPLVAFAALAVKKKAPPKGAQTSGGGAEASC